MPDDTDTAALETRLAELERTDTFLRKQLAVHADNTEAALQSHKSAMAVYADKSKLLDDALARMAALEGQVKELQEKVPPGVVVKS